MNKDLSVYPEQAIQEILELNKKAIDYGNRIIQWCSEDDIDRAVAKQELDNAILNFVVLLEQYPDKHGTLLKEARSLLTSSRRNPLKAEVVGGEPYLFWPYCLLNLVNMFRSIHLPEKKVNLIKASIHCWKSLIDRNIISPKQISLRVVQTQKMMFTFVLKGSSDASMVTLKQNHGYPRK